MASRNKHALMGVCQTLSDLWKKNGRTNGRSVLPSNTSHIHLKLYPRAPPLAALDLVTSMVHLKMKYHKKNGDVATIFADLKGAARCHKAWGSLPAP